MTTADEEAKKMTRSASNGCEDDSITEPNASGLPNHLTDEQAAAIANQVAGLDPEKEMEIIRSPAMQELFDAIDQPPIAVHEQVGVFTKYADGSTVIDVHPHVSEAKQVIHDMPVDSNEVHRSLRRCLVVVMPE